jgi:hypothetical protein
MPQCKFLPASKERLLLQAQTDKRVGSLSRRAVSTRDAHARLNGRATQMNSLRTIGTRFEW